MQRKLDTSFGKIMTTIGALYCRVTQIVPCTVFAVLTIIVQDSNRHNDCTVP